MQKYEIVYRVDDGYCEENITETFEGSFTELQDYLSILKSEGCYQFSVADLTPECYE